MLVAFPSISERLLLAGEGRFARGRPQPGAPRQPRPPLARADVAAWYQLGGAPHAAVLRDLRASGWAAAVP